MKPASMQEVRNRQTWNSRQRRSSTVVQWVFWSVLILYALFCAFQLNQQPQEWVSDATVNVPQDTTKHTVEAIFDEGDTFCTLTFIRCAKGNVGLVE